MNIDTDRKSFYAYIRSRSRTWRTIGPLVDDKSDLTVSQHDLAEKFNSYFASVFTVEDTSSLPSANTTLTDVPVTKLLDISVNEAVVRKKLTKIWSDKAGGADDMSPRILSELKEEICYPVTAIMRTSLESGVVPEDWKMANVTPIFKKCCR